MKIFRRCRWATTLLAVTLLILPPTPPTADAGHFGFRGGFRGGFGHAGFGRGFHRGFGGFSQGYGGFNRGFVGFNRGFRRSGFRGFSGFSRSRFNSLAFRSRGFGFRRGFVGFGPRFGFSRGFASRSRFGPRVVASRGFARRGPLLIANQHVVGRPVLASRIATGDGWRLLGEGRPRLAAEAFSNRIAADTSAGMPKVGFALAAAETGDLDKGVWAMRRAFALDPERVGDMMLDDELRPVVSRVAGKYEQLANNDGINADSAFMMSALYQLQGDPEMASMAMEYAQEENNQPSSTTRLASLIKREMAAMPMASGPGWDLLAADQPAEAMNAFVNTIAQDKQAGEPKVGYALAAAASGDLDRGVWAMRRAFAIDPDHVSDMMLSGKVRPIIERVTKAYETAESNADSRFMLAALYQLQDEGEQAMHAIEKSIKDNEAAEGSRSLFKLVSTEVRMASAGDDYRADENPQALPETTFVADGVADGPSSLPPPPGEKLVAPPTTSAKPLAVPPLSDNNAAHDYKLDGPAVVRRVIVGRPAPVFLGPSKCGF